jgi:hypothetical protein
MGISDVLEYFSGIVAVPVAAAAVDSTHAAAVDTGGIRTPASAASAPSTVPVSAVVSRTVSAAPSVQDDGRQKDEMKSVVKKRRPVSKRTKALPDAEAV